MSATNHPGGSISWIADSVEPGSHRRPFHTFLLKIASRCNLDCTYCYVYHSPDQSWRERPKVMPVPVLEATAERIAEHVRRHDLDTVDIVFHGGEPLLVGIQLFETYIEVLSRLIPCRISFGLQTNGTLLNEAWVKTLSRHGVGIGVSIDGFAPANDLNRRFHSGEGSFDTVLEKISLLNSTPDGKSVLGGYLAVVDLKNPPREVYRFFRSIEATSLDLILPDAHYERPPYRPTGANSSVAYGHWLVAFFDAWFTEQPELEVRLFDEILVLMLGGPSAHESIGAKSVDLVIIESDGAVEPVDTLKVVGRQATYTGLTVFANSFDDALDHPSILARMSGYDGLCDTCQSCRHLAHCGGGYFPHRYSKDRGFQNPSVYCADLQFLFNHIQAQAGIGVHISSNHRD